MPKLRVTIIDEVRNRRLKVDLPDDAAIEKLLPALAKKLGLPPVAYQLTHEATGRALGGDQTLAFFGVREGDALRLAAAKKRLPAWAWVGIVGVVLLAVAALAYWVIRLELVPTLTVVAEVTTLATAPTAMPRPTATPLPPTDTAVPPTATPVPTSTPRPTATSVLTYYDDNFNDPAFDGTYNTGLWSRVESRPLQAPTVEQRDGVLVVSQTSGSLNYFVELSTEKHSNWLLSDLDSFMPPNAEELKDDSFHVAVGVYLEPNSSATGYIDDVRIGK
jgi:hypothetical protein